MQESPKASYAHAIGQYLDLFCEKQGLSFEFWHGDVPGSAAYFGDMMLQFTDIVYDIDTKQEPGKISDWYSNLHFRSQNIPYRTYCYFV